MIYRLVILFLLAGAASAFGQKASEPSNPAAASAPEVTTPEARLEQIQMEFQKLNQQLQAIQRTAMQRDAVQEKGEVFHDALEAEMLEIAPDDMRKTVKQRFRLADRLENASQETPATQEEETVLRETARKLQQKMQEVAEYEQQAVQASDVMPLRQDYVAAISAAMEKVNPEFPQLVQRQRALAQEFQQIQQDLQQK